MVLKASAASQDQPASDTADRDARVGLVFLLLMAMAVLGAIWLARLQFTRDYAVYDVELAGQVQGLARGGAVFLNGVRTGEVVDLALNPADPSKVVARIRVSADTPVRQDTTATLEWLGVSGTRLLQLSGGTLAKPLLPRVPSGADVPVIRAAPGVFDANNPQDKPAATQALEALDTLNKRLSDQNLAAIGAALSDVRDTASAWRGRTKDLATLDTQLSQTAKTADDLAATAGSINERANGEARRQLQQLAARSENAKASIRRARGQLAQTGAAAGAGVQRLQAITPKVAQAGALVERAGEVVTRLEGEGQALGAPASREIKVAK